MNVGTDMRLRLANITHFARIPYKFLEFLSVCRRIVSRVVPEENTILSLFPLFGFFRIKKARVAAQYSGIWGWIMLTATPRFFSTKKKK